MSANISYGLHQATLDQLMGVKQGPHYFPPNSVWDFGVNFASGHSDRLTSLVFAAYLHATAQSGALLVFASSDDVDDEGAHGQVLEHPPIPRSSRDTPSNHGDALQQFVRPVHAAAGGRGPGDRSTCDVEGCSVQIHAWARRYGSETVQS